MKFSWRAVAALLFYVLGVLGWLYVGGWMILTKPVKGIVLAQIAGNLTLMKLVAAFVQGFIMLSLAGGIWCVGYMISNHFKDNNK